MKYMYIVTKHDKKCPKTRQNTYFEMARKGRNFFIPKMRSVCREQLFTANNVNGKG